ncbi:hypothetical protein ACK8OR_15730 [Jannaschia sp. KMU-145]|uniref:hypothetical protein n=1 Tax=Jannaschia halovivens TaxID=3388667 RepID=UPI00396B261A
MKCIDLPYIGGVCAPDLHVSIAGSTYDLTSPGGFAILALIVAFALFLFRSPA